MKTLPLLVLVFLLCGCQSQEGVVAADEQTPIDNTLSAVTDAEDNTDEEDTVYYGQNEISPDDFVRVPYSVVEVPDNTDSETIDYSDNIEITLLSDMTLIDSVADSKIFVRNNKTVGGIHVIDSSEDILTDPFSDGLSEYLSNTIMPAIDASASDYMIESSTLSYVEVTFSSTDNEYIHYIFRGNDVDYDIWFHRNHFTGEEEHQILQSLIIDDQTAETTASAVPDASSFNSQELTFNLLEDMAVTHTQEEGGLISYRGNIIGGYVEAAFRKGVLTDPDSNKEEIISTLVDSVHKHIDLSDFAATVSQDFYIQVRFNNTEVEYVHYVIYFSDVDTYYDIWFDVNQADTNTITQIIDSASIILR